MKASEIMELIIEYKSALLTARLYCEGTEFRKKFEEKARKIVTKLEAVADEYAALKHCYSPDKVFKITEKIE